MSNDINYFKENRGMHILVFNSKHGYQELSKYRSPEGTCITINTKIGLQTVPIEKFDELNL